MRSTQKRLWGMEIARGLITMMLGLFFLTARSFAPRLFISSLGVYLVIDGILELYGVSKRKHFSHLQALDYAGGASSLLSGLLCLILPTLTLLLLTIIVAVRIIMSGVVQMRSVRRSRAPHSGFLWLYSALFVLLGLLLLFFPLLVITFLVVFLGIYMVAAGLFLLLRGLSLRFTLKHLSPSTPQPIHAPLAVPNDLPASTRRALVFIRRTGANGLGHIGWAFEWMNGWFNVGSVENLKGKPFASPAEMDFWCMHTLDPIATMQQRQYAYDEYKLFFVAEPQPKQAWQTVIWESQQPYSFVHHNCCDVAYEILRTYGCQELLDPAKEFVPNDWYDALPATSYPIAESPAIPLSLHKQSPREIAMHEIALAIPSRLKGSPPSWRTSTWRPWEELMLMWDMMIGHIQTLFISAIKLIAQHFHGRKPLPD